MENGRGKLAIDVMGADLGIQEIMLGVKTAFEMGSDLPDIILVGDEAKIKDLLQNCGLLGNPKISICHASQVITMDDKGVLAVKQKKDSSMMRAIDLVKSGEAETFLSCGNTGALMAGSTIKLRTLAGIERPALATVIPTKDHSFILIDVGANPSPTPIHLVHNAILGTNFCRIELGVEKPRVGLLTIGTEEGKGTDVTNKTHTLLKLLGKEGIINYAGLIEGFDLFERSVDVVVCDGFVGNILLKTVESLFRTFKQILKEELMMNPWRKLGAILTMGAFKNFKDRFNPDRYGKALLMGLNGNVVKSHGSANRQAIAYTIKSITHILKLDINEQIKKDAEAANAIIERNTEKEAQPKPLA